MHENQPDVATHIPYGVSFSWKNAKKVVFTEEKSGVGMCALLFRGIQSNMSSLRHLLLT
jgi:hypothetical protein